MVTEATITLVEQIAALEPLSGAALAISLAYLALDRFRYRDRIQSHSAKILRESVINIEGVSHTTAFGSLIWLANADAPSSCQKACKDARENGSPLKDKPPFGFKSTAYDWLYRWPLSEAIIAALSVLAFFTLTSGVLIEAGIWDTFSVSFVSYVSIRLILVLLLLGCILPAFFVWLGRICVDWGINFSDEMGEELKKTIDAIERQAEGMQSDVKNLETPQLG